MMRPSRALGIASVAVTTACGQAPPTPRVRPRIADDAASKHAALQAGADDVARDGWVTIRPTGEDFAVLMPPSVRYESTHGGPLQKWVASSPRSGAALTLLQVKGGLEARNLENVLDALAKGCGGARQSMTPERMNDRVVTSATLTCASGGIVRVRAIELSNELLVMCAAASPSTDLDAEARRFFDSAQQPAPPDDRAAIMGVKWWGLVHVPHASIYMPNDAVEVEEELMPGRRIKRAVARINGIDAVFSLAEYTAPEGEPLERTVQDLVGAIAARSECNGHALAEPVVRVSSEHAFARVEVACSTHAIFAGEIHRYRGATVVALLLVQAGETRVHEEQVRGFFPSLKVHD